MMVKSLWREPLVHFVALGLLLFIGDRLWARHVVKADYTIVVKAAEIERQAVIFAGENRRQPTDADIKGLLFAHVEEQVLMREAKRLGLDADDTIIRRRLAQKMRFLIENVDSPALPNDRVLATWFEDHKAEFTQAETRSFSHIYISPEAKGESLEEVTKALVAKVTDASWDGEKWKALGDPFMTARQFTSQGSGDVARQFGPGFSAALFDLDFDLDEKGSGWQGPISSAFGLHLIRLDNVTAQSDPIFDKVREKVGARWQEQTQREANHTRLKDLIEKYKVDIDDLKLEAGQ